MELFRKNQKLVFYILTPIIILAFVVWGVGDFWGAGSNYSLEIGTVNGKKVTSQEFEAFQKRFQAAIGSNIAFYFNGPFVGSQHEDLWKYIFTLALLEDAEKAGSRASDLEVGTYLENGHPDISPKFKGDRQALDDAVNALCARHQISRQEFLAGVRDYLGLRNYLADVSDLSVSNDATAYAGYALSKADCVVKRIHVMETDAIREQAKTDVIEKPAAELESRVRAYVAENSRERRYREPSGWRFAYVLVPFVPAASVREPGKKEIEDFFESNTARFEGKMLGEVEEQIKAELRLAEIERQTMRNYTVDVDPQLRRQGGELELPELLKLTALAKFGAVGNDTGAELLSPADVLKKLPAGADATLRMMLESLGSQTDLEQDEDFRQWQSGYLLLGRPFRSDEGYFRLRLLEFKPSSPMAVDDADGNIRPEIFELAVADLVGERADELVDQQAARAEEDLRALMAERERNAAAASGAAAEFAALPVESIPYAKLVEDNSPLLRLSVGELVGPFPYKDPQTGADGRELVALVERRLPSPASFAAEPETVKNRVRQGAAGAFQTGISLSYTMRGPAIVIQPNPAIMGDLLARNLRGEVTVNPLLLREQPREGADGGN